VIGLRSALQGRVLVVGPSKGIIGTNIEVVVGSGTLVFRSTAMSGMKGQTHLDIGAKECSFCRKSQFVVGKLVCNPDGFRTKVYICDECILVCTYVLGDDAGRLAHDPVNIDSQKRPAVLDNPLTPLLLRSVERWIKLESQGANSAADFEELRSLALRLFAPRT